MGGLRTGFLVLILGATAANANGRFLQVSPAARVEMLQTCAGRLSAQVEFLWLFGGEAADEATRVRKAFDDMLDATMAEALAWGMPEPMAMHWRLVAKAAQADLLSTAAFSLDKPRAERARRLAAERLAECDGIPVG